MNTELPITLKSGEKYGKGLKIVSWCPKGKPTLCEVMLPDGRIIIGRIRLVVKRPSIQLINKWSYDSVCDSILGNTVEPDGYDSEGSPSWLLALGMV